VKPILEIKNISKKFRILHERQPYLSLRESFTSLFRSKTSTKEDFWALKDISADIYPGDTVGVIGKNGAGKSTLLKILSKITPPSEGRIISRGRIASLLEVGTGFHPELSGRENIFLNGSILGMRRAEINKKFDEIVDFSGVEKFLDTPLKHYSSGMQVRLAFSVAAYLENEILIVDEVLAVGDASFQKKCLGKMDDVSKSGRTILFVSHNLEALSNLCKKSILLQDGKMAFSGSLHAGVQTYLNEFKNSKNLTYTAETGKTEVFLKKARITNEDKVLTNGQDLKIEFVVSSVNETSFSFHAFMFREGTLAFIGSDYCNSVYTASKNKKEVSFTLTIPRYLLNPGYHQLGIMMADFYGNQVQYYNNMNILNFEILDDGYRRGNKYNLDWPGSVSPIFDFNMIS
jgi:lipopolysaccharide transport system ATP-binding protein